MTKWHESMEVGQEINVRLPNLMSFIAKVKRVDEKGERVHLEPPPKRVLPFLYAGVKVTVSITIGDALLLFDSTIAEIAETNVSLQGSAGLKNGLQRSYYRLPEQAPIRLVYGSRSYQLDCATSDLSGGGLRLSISSARLVEPLQLGSHVAFDLALAHSQSIHGKAKVAWIRTIKGQVSVGLEFVTISEQDRNRITKHLLMRQAELRRLGLL